MITASTIISNKNDFETYSENNQLTDSLYKTIVVNAYDSACHVKNCYIWNNQ